MVTKQFYIEGEDVIDVGLRPALLDKALECDVSLHATNQPKEKRVKVIVNGDVESIEEFLQIIQKEDIRIRTSIHKCILTKLEEYDGPEIDWNRYEIRFMARQMSKGFREAVQKLVSIESSIDKLKPDNQTK